MAIAIEFARESDLWAGLPEADEVVRQAVAATLATAALVTAPGAELSVVLTGDAGIRTINGEWRGKDAPTNVLSFPAAEPDAMATSPLIGDLVFAYETMDREARHEGVGLADHLAHLTVHGLLHCFGHDHQTDDEAEAMEALEVRVLKSLGIADPYADAVLVEGTP